MKIEDRVWRVAKTLRPGQAGTRKLLRRYGEALVCVRYREDPAGRARRISIELTIEELPIQRQVIWASIPMSRADLRSAAMEMGAVWDSTRRRWRMRRTMAMALGLKIDEEV
jgi:hypothetical protein